jgi:hypothetical protein
MTVALFLAALTAATFGVAAVAAYIVDCLERREMYRRRHRREREALRMSNGPRSLP